MECFLGRTRVITLLPENSITYSTSWFEVRIDEAEGADDMAYLGVFAWDNKLCGSKP